MNKLKRYAKIIVVVFVMINMFSISVLASRDIPKAPSGSSVYDEAGILSSETIDYVNRMNIAMQDTGAQIGVVVLDTLSGENLEMFSNELFQAWGIGDSSKNNGVLILVSMEERDIRIEVGYGLEGAITDGKAGNIIRNGISTEFQNGNYDQGIRNGVESLVVEIQEEYDVIFDADAVSYSGESSNNSSGILSLVLFIIIVIIASFGKPPGGRRRIYRRRYYGRGFYGGGGGSSGGGGFGGFGGGRSGGGGASGGW